MSPLVLRPGEVIVLQAELDADHAVSNRYHEALVLICELSRERSGEAQVIAARALREDPQTGRVLGAAVRDHILETVRGERRR